MSNEWYAFWAMTGVVILVPSLCLWLRRRRQTESVRDSWRRADQQGRVRAREERRQ